MKQTRNSNMNTVNFSSTSDWESIACKQKQGNS